MLASIYKCFFEHDIHSDRTLTLFVYLPFRTEYMKYLVKKYAIYETTNTADLPECDPASELSNRAFSLAPSNSSTESFIAVWKTANWPNTTEEDKIKIAISWLMQLTKYILHMSTCFLHESTHRTEETPWCNRSRPVWWCSSVGSLVTERLPLSLRTVPHMEL